MLTRILEPEVMDTPADAAEYDAMDHATVNERFVADFLAFAGSPTGEILDLGTGTARIPIALCRTADDCRVVAADLSISMLDVAKINVEIAGLTERILLHHVDTKALDYNDGRFDWVISNSLIHHLPEPARAFQEAIRVVGDVGGLFFRDLLRPASLAELETLVQTYTNDETEAARKLFADSLHAALDLAEVRAHVAELGFDPTSVVQTSDRHWTWQARTSDRAQRKLA
ncbi:MAG: methyltransferase domain-containing protein [Planctomycetales bacterium]|nr:methyltransferase domain-containing protein [Planctomycetales bacterium]